MLVMDEKTIWSADSKYLDDMAECYRVKRIDPAIRGTMESTYRRPNIRLKIPRYIASRAL